MSHRLSPIGSTSLPAVLLQWLVMAALQSSSPTPLVDGNQLPAEAQRTDGRYHWWVLANCSQLGVEDSERDWFAVFWKAMATGQATLCLLGLVNNFINLVCLRRDAAHATQNVLLVSLSVCDWLIVFIMSVDSVCHIAGNVEGVPMSIHWACVFLHPFPITGLQFALLTVHGWTTVALAATRYLMIRFPLKSRAWVSKRRLVALSGFVWLAGMATGVPRLTDTFAVVCTNREAAMIIGRSYYPVYSSVHTWGLQVVVPMALCIILNVQVVLAVSRSKRTESSIDEIRRQAKVNRMVLAITSIYVVCQSFSVFFFLNTVLPWKRAVFELLDLMGNFVYSLDASLSFFVYLATNDNFRREVRRLLALPRSLLPADIDHPRRRCYQEASGASSTTMAAVTVSSASL